MEANSCSMYACPDGWEVKPDSMTYCDDRLAPEQKDQNDYWELDSCHIFDKFPWKSIRQCQLTATGCSGAVCWDIFYDGFDDCCQRKQDPDSTTQCFGKLKSCSGQFDGCEDGQVILENASYYCRDEPGYRAQTKSDSPLQSCDDYHHFTDNCCHYLQNNPSLEVAEYTIQEYAVGGQQFPCLGDDIKLDWCLTRCTALGESCMVVNYQHKYL